MTSWRERAKIRMADLGVTQERLSEHFGMTPAGIQKWLAGTRQPTLEEIDRIADFLGLPGPTLTHGVTAEELATGLEEPALGVIRQLIVGARSGALDARVFAHLQSTLTLLQPAAPLGAPVAPEHQAQIQALSDQAEAQHAASTQRRRASRP